MTEQRDHDDEQPGAEIVPLHPDGPPEIVPADKAELRSRSRRGAVYQGHHEWVLVTACRSSRSSGGAGRT